LRPELEAEGLVTAAEVSDPGPSKHGRWVEVGGVALIRQRPATASGVVFITIEDETGVANLIVRPHVYERHRRAARHGVILRASGTVERAGEVVHVLVRRLGTLDERLAELQARSRDFH
ncbi:MAG: OB-fold nucleic acid binding domain-containing protein, partial [Phycisphaeraceae bacterium]